MTLFIGGPWDGKWHDIPDIDSWRVAVHQPLQPLYKLTPQSESVSIETIDYKKTALHLDSGTVINVMVLPGINPMKALIKGYRN